MRLLYSVMALALAGCALESASQPADDLAREPPYRTIVARSIVPIVGDPGKLGVIEISGVRRAEAFKGPAWQVCLKSDVYAQPRYHAVFIQNEKVLESRLAVMVDQCEQQSYTPFNEWIAASKPPVPESDGRKPAEKGRR